MKKVLFALVCAVVMFSSCGDSAVKLNDTIVDKVDGTVGMMDKVMNYIQNEDYATATAYLDTVSLHVTSSVEQIGKLDNKSGEEFKQSAIELLNMVGNEGVPAYKKALEIFQDPAKYNDGIELINDFIDKVQKQQNLLQEKQREFATKNNVTLR